MLCGVVGSSCVSWDLGGNLSPEEELLAFESGPTSETLATGAFMIVCWRCLVEKNPFSGLS